MTNKTIYAVTIPNCGDCDTNRVVTICSTKEKAEAFLKLYPDSYFSFDQPEIEEFDLDEYSAQIEQGLLCWGIQIYLNGDITYLNQESPEGFNEQINYSKEKLHISLFAKNETEAIALAREKLNQWCKDRVKERVEQMDLDAQEKRNKNALEAKGKLQNCVDSYLEKHPEMAARFPNNNL